MVRPVNDQKGREYTQRFDTKNVPLIQAGPVEDRSCMDKFCLIAFFIFLGFFGFFTAYFIIRGAGNLDDITDQNSVTGNDDSLGSVFAQVIPEVIGMLFLSIVLSILFVILTVKFPKCVVYTGIVVTFLVYLALIVLGIVIEAYALSIVFGIVMLINACILYCCRHQIKVGIVLLKVSGLMMQSKPQIVVLGFTSLLLNIVFVTVYIAGYVTGYSETLPEYNDDQESRDTVNGLLIGYIITTVFFGYFLYYLLVFVLSTAVAHWYYQMDKSIFYGYKTVQKHMGSLTFASVVITIITIARRAAQQQADGDNGALGIVCCIVACLISCIENLVQVLNHNAIIVMSVTGQGYIDSAKSAIGCIFNNFSLFVIVDFITSFIQFYALVICVLLPSFIGALWIYRSQDEDTTNAVVGGIAIFLLSWIVSSVVLGVLYEILSAIYIFYCFDRKFRAQGIRAGNIPPEIKRLLDGADDGDSDVDNRPASGTEMKPMQKQPDIYHNQPPPNSYNNYNNGANPYYQPPNVPSQNYPNNQWGNQYGNNAGYK